MGMSKRDFIAMAIEFGNIKENLSSTDLNPKERASEEYIFDECLSAFCEVARQSNGQFKTGYFVEFVNEVSRGERDGLGRMVKKSKSKV